MKVSIMVNRYGNGDQARRRKFISPLLSVPLIYRSDIDQSPKRSKPQFHINFKFSGIRRSSIHVVHENTIDTTDLPLPETGVFLDLEQFLCHEKVRETISKELENWRSLTCMQCKALVRIAILRARMAVIGMPASHNVLRLRFRVTVVKERYFEIREVSIDQIIEGSMDEVDRIIEHSMDEVRVVPTDKYRR
ncbi:hypothetical protein DH2020_032595 [Rehmannia glutinosa]|uniref:Uncharacterized protein n=1 Tax=Rehmannia glutinosa TaxID=99300 RepID=A0ABR0VER6_REHGL